MGKGSQNQSETTSGGGGGFDNDSTKQSTAANRLYKWHEIEKHNKPDDCWIVVNDAVYDMTRFMKKHPGGEKIIELYAGQYATVREK
jgi:cytochrome b involved in lipid metabolism